MEKLNSIKIVFWVMVALVFSGIGLWGWFRPFPGLSIASLEISLALVLVGAGIGFSNFTKKVFCSMNRKTWSLLVLLLFFVFSLSYFVVPRTNRILVDEVVYENIAQNIVWAGKAVISGESWFRDGHFSTLSGVPNKEPNGYPFYLSLFFRCFGVSEAVAHFSNNIGLILGCFSVCTLVLLLTQSAFVALIAAALYGLNPIALIWSNSASAETTACAFAIIAIIGAFYFSRERSRPSLFFLMGAVGLAVQFRPESILVLLPVTLILLQGGRWRSKRWFWAIPAMALILAPYLVHLWTVRNQSWGAEGSKFAVSYVRENFRTNVLFFFDNTRFPVVASILAVIGFFSPEARASRWTLLVWLFSFFGLFLFFYAGSYEHFGFDVRFSLLVMAPLAVLAGCGSYWLYRHGVRITGIPPKQVLTAMILLLALNWSQFLPSIRIIGEPLWSYRVDADFSREMARSLPPDSLVISHTPPFWLMQRVSARYFNPFDAQSETILREGRNGIRYFADFRGGIYFHWDSWCYLPILKKECSRLLGAFKSELIRKTPEYKGDFVALYRLFP